MADWRGFLASAFVEGVVLTWALLVLRTGLRSWWERRAVRIAFAATVGVAVAQLALLAAGALLHGPAARTLARALTGAVLAFMVPLAATLPAAAVTMGILTALTRGKGRDGDGAATPAPPSPSPPTPEVPARETPAASGGAAAPPLLLTRRRVIHSVAGAIPAAGALASADGLLLAHGAVGLPLVRVAVPDLHGDLVGLKILHLTDLHLGMFRHVVDVEDCLARAAAHAPDLIVLTGDIADDVGELGPALAAAAAARPRLGVFACLGNHEHFRELGRVRRVFDRSAAHLLVDRSQAVPVGSATLSVSGVDDPGFGAEPIRQRLRRSVARALDGAPGDALQLLLSHRPDGFHAARSLGVHLTLSGHTHGSQIGVGDRSLFEPFFPDRFLRGAYRREGSQLYTSSGFGHWFPFRLNCPAEAPIIVLERA